MWRSPQLEYWVASRRHIFEATSRKPDDTISVQVHHSEQCKCVWSTRICSANGHTITPCGGKGRIAIPYTGNDRLTIMYGGEGIKYFHTISVPLNLKNTIPLHCMRSLPGQFLGFSLWRPLNRRQRSPYRPRRNEE